MSDDQNMLLLRSDLHHLFDTRRIALIPKQIDLDTSRPPQLLVHVLEPSNSAQLVPLFAWSLFTDERIPFVSWPGMFNILLWNKITNSVETRVCTSKDVSSFSQVFDPSTRSQSRSVSPKKRQMTDASEWGDIHSDGEDTLGDDGCFGDSSFDQDESLRGRPLFRRPVAPLH
ncbi:uncharacterized protein PpBr36_11285 [Pyricularia pennisetigena]|uniref:uncharacterized protein n=1 Tax=Pyricularia pennisetigena TaxID=1578925 RepID=UPI00114FCC60|nr:uncharacterized protein PpBr36_11285 [Pyricularia pennisetigena]TLS20431.1 hypothetical protein PpBr36_11285 [Pyricularia pennisetigena]